MDVWRAVSIAAVSRSPRCVSRGAEVMELFDQLPQVSPAALRRIRLLASLAAAAGLLVIGWHLLIV